MILEKGYVVNERYRIEETIGKGGMAVVYKASDIKLDRAVTLKVLKSEYIENEEFIKRFSTEARAAAGLAHTNIVNVYDVGNDGDIYYIVMEYIDGYTLKELIYEQAPLDNMLACDIASQIAEGLEAAHENGITHRDIKPENILLTESGGRLVAKVTDFGIAKANTAESSQGDYMGSVHYFSPEQAKGDDVDSRTDIYSLGIVLYEMVTGECPFEGKTPLDFAMKHIKEPIPDPRSVNPKVTRDIIDIIRLACAKEPRNRYEHAIDMADDLRDVMDKNFINEDRSDKKLPPVSDGYEDDMEEDDEDRELKRRERNVIITAIITGIAIILLITFGGKLLSRTLYGDSIKVPNFVGMSYDRACAKAERRGLTVEKEEIYQEDVEAGEVAQQEPEKGARVEKGGVVTLYVSYGAGDIEVPDIEGMRRSVAEDELSECGLAIGSVEYVNSDKPVGEIVEQDPKAGEMVPADARINVKVSQGTAAEEVRVPNLRLKTREEASELLDELGLNAKFIDAYSDTVPVDSVIDQGIPAETLVPIGSQIIVTLCKGEKEEQTEAPTEGKPAIIDIIEKPTKAPEPETEAPASDEGGDTPDEQSPSQPHSAKQEVVSIPVNPKADVLKDSDNAVRVTAVKNGSEVVLKEMTLSKGDFPFAVNDTSDGNTKYTVTVNGITVYSDTK